MTKTAIIGGGIGGLVTALLLSREENREVTIFEKNDHLGGRLTYERHGEFKIDQGPTIILLPDMLLDILEEGGIPREDIPIIPCSPLYDVHFEDGKSFVKFSDPERQKEELRAKFPGNEKHFDRFLADMRTRFLQGKSQFLEKSFVEKRTFFSRKNLKTLMKLKAYQNVKKMMRSYFDDERLIEAYTLQTLYIGGHPEQSPAMYSLVSYSEHEHGIWYMKGGYARLVDIIQAELQKRGVVIRTGTAVEEVLVEGGTAKGIATKEGRAYYDELVMNGDFPIMDRMLPERYRLNRKYTPSSGCLLLYMGLDRNYPNHSIHQFFMTGDFDRHMRQVFQDKMLPDDPSFYTFHPSLVDDSLAPAGKGVLYTLIPVPSGEEVDWSGKDRLIEHVLDQMEERGFPDLREHIEWLHVRTPAQAEQEGLYAGGSFGIAPTLFQSGVFRPQLQPYQIDHLYAVGASIHPGGGVPIVMQGAKILADYLQFEGKARHNYKRGV
ncbi:phytoene desaturase family protein [Halobacillus sp. ACCC02827]|uniref:phytoene desaturase family protein n=1 Tax=Halobacillus sp. ACCC02827 TaxID=3052090 RepID=UPI002570986B|nr:phytoene desaturase family protein [Halobacillus sp. ACCC02827]WJE17263.1 phytoene desaturase family protein [Halobacillus sp. ACCC02827]